MQRKYKSFKKILIWSLLNIVSQFSFSATNTYYGTANLETPASIGTIDLAFKLDITGTNIQSDISYIDPGKTLLFPVIAPQVNGEDAGPRVSGSLTNTTFNLTSVSFTSEVSGATVTRQVSLSNAAVSNEGAFITGDYTETVSGLAAHDITITGTFTLVSAAPLNGSVQDQTFDGCLDLSEIRKGGLDPSMMEFSDVSFAMNLYHNPSATLRLGNRVGANCNGADQILQSALQEYYDTQQ